MKDTEMKGMVLKSILFHVSIILIFTVKTVFFPSDIPVYERAIRVDIVGLPDKIAPDQKLSPKKTETTAPAPSPQIASPTPPPKAAVSTPAPKKNLEKNQNQALNRLKAMSAIERLKQQQQEEVQAKAAKEASTVIRGNVISPGTALRGITKLEFDEYIGAIDSHVKNNWGLPEWMLNQNFRAEVLVRIDSSGNLIERRFIKKSGNEDFDSRVWSAIEKSSPFPAPPEKFKDILSIQGITFAFPE